MQRNMNYDKQDGNSNNRANPGGANDGRAHGLDADRQVAGGAINTGVNPGNAGDREEDSKLGTP